MVTIPFFEPVVGNGGLFGPWPMQAIVSTFIEWFLGILILYLLFLLHALEFPVGD